MRLVAVTALAACAGALVGYAIGYAWERLIERPWIGAVR